ncbi:MAG: hypothetical protein RL687_47 [Candidatus Parcubacteria bacterium]|jgi:small subunit ribosomal protein S14
MRYRNHLPRTVLGVVLLKINYNMAKTSVIARHLKKSKFTSRETNRCFRCGRGHAFMRDFGLCRICFREMANEGMLPGVRKSSW